MIILLVQRIYTHSTYLTPPKSVPNLWCSGSNVGEPLPVGVGQLNRDDRSAGSLSSWLDGDSETRQGRWMILFVTSKGSMLSKKDRVSTFDKSHLWLEPGRWDTCTVINVFYSNRLSANPDLWPWTIIRIRSEHPIHQPFHSFVLAKWLLWLGRVLFDVTSSPGHFLVRHHPRSID